MCVLRDGAPLIVEASLRPLVTVVSSVRPFLKSVQDARSFAHRHSLGHGNHHHHHHHPPKNLWLARTHCFTHCGGAVLCPWILGGPKLPPPQAIIGDPVPFPNWSSVSLPSGPKPTLAYQLPGLGAAVVGPLESSCWWMVWLPSLLTTHVLQDTPSLCFPQCQKLTAHFSS